MSIVTVCSVVDFLYSDHFVRSPQQLLYTFVRNINHTWWNYVFILLLITFIRKINVLYSLCFILVVIYKSAPTFFVFKKISPALLIGYNNIHPILFYIFLFSALFYLLIDDVQQIFTLDKITRGAILTLFLGGLWGAGNSAWGFFWVNDHIELSLLKYISLLLLLLHTHVLEKRRKNIFIVLSLLVLQLLALRWGFVFTRHSFFNLNALVNVFKFFIFLCNTAVSLFPLFFISADDLSGFFLFFLLVYALLLFLKSRTTLFKNVNLHITILVLTLAWLKIKPHNLTIFIGFNPYKGLSVFYSAITTYITGFLFDLGSDSHAVIRGITNYMYIYKSQLNNYIIFQGWSRFFLVIAVVSMWKI